jgi:hypothetical protein
LRPGYVLFSVMGNVKGQDIKSSIPETSLALYSFSDQWIFLNTINTLRFIINGEERLTIGKMERIDSNVRSGGVREVLGIEIPFSLAVKLSRASKLEAQIGLYEFELKPEQIAEIKRFVSYFPAAERKESPTQLMVVPKSEPATGSRNERVRPATPARSTGGYIRGPRGGCYYLSGSGRKVYVDRSLCN